MSRTTRLLPLLIALLGVAALLTPLTLARAVTPPAQSVTSGRDFATTAWQDPWDFSNPSDLLLDNNGPAMHLSRQSISGGLLNFVIGSPGYISPLWAGYPGSLRLGRDGAAAANMIDASTYKRFHMHAYASSHVSLALEWFTCGAPTSSCMGGMPLGLAAGWNDIDVPIANNSRLISTGKAWSGKIQGLRVAMTPHPSASLRVDSLRVYQPVASALTWASPDSGPAKLWWTDTSGGITAARGQHVGVVLGNGSANSHSTVSTSVAGYAPGTYFWSVSSTGSKTFIGRTTPAPRPIVDSPSAAGCASYLGRPWTFSSVRSLAGYGDATSLAFSSTRVLSATNAGPRRNDPYIYLPIGRGGIDGRVYHRLTIVESYDGAFDLRNAAGGGTMGRILWQSAGHTVLAQTNDILTYSGKRSISLDLAMPASALTEPDGSASQRYAFASTARVTKLRWDPNEDPGARRWHVYSIRLAADCATSTTFAMTWHDAAWTSGSTARIEARSTTVRSAVTIGRVTERAGTNAFTFSAAALPAGAYKLRVYVTNPQGSTVSATSTGPLVIKH
jgi:hypothetical protein